MPCSARCASCASGVAELYERLHLHFFGTSNQTRPDAAPRVLPVARELGVADRVSEIAPRIDYLDALTVQVQATAILMLGSSESHYTASKLYPALLAGRPIFAIHHAESSVVEILRRAARPSMARVITYTDAERAESRIDAIYGELSALMRAEPSEVPASVSEPPHASKSSPPPPWPEGWRRPWSTCEGARPGPRRAVDDARVIARFA